MERPTIPCELCGEHTAMRSTRRCDRCWELERRIEDDPDLAAAILARVFIGRRHSVRG